MQISLESVLHTGHTDAVRFIRMYIGANENVHTFTRYYTVLVKSPAPSAIDNF